MGRNKQCKINQAVFDDSEKKCRTTEPKISMSIHECQIKVSLFYKELLVLNISTINISLMFPAARAVTP